MNTQNTRPAVPFFARASANKSVTVRSGLQAGLTEHTVKLCEEARK